jgi:hypothetical protein
VSGDDITALRAELFATLRGVRAGTLALDQARVVNEIGKTLIESAKVEVDYLRANGGGESPFIEAVGNANLPPGVTGITRHRIKG